jgi:transcriptional regulator with XRE-family HTH domain
MLARQSLTTQVRIRLRQLAADKRLRQSVVAQDLGVDASTVNKTIHDDSRPITLEFLEAVAERTQIPVAELVCPPTDTIRQLNPDEIAIFRYVRSWPASVRLALLHFLNYWADETAPDAQTRGLHEVWRHLSATDRARPASSTF